MPNADLSVVLIANSYYPADEEGGPPFSNRELANSMARAGVRVAVVTTDRNGAHRLDVPKNQWVTVGNTPVYYAATEKGTWLRSPTFSRTASQAIRSADVCVLSAVFWSYTGLAAWFACRRFNVPYVTYARGFLSPWALDQKSVKKAFYWRLIARRIVNGSKALVALADQEARDYSRLHLTPPITVIPNGAHVDEGQVADHPTSGTNPGTFESASGDYFLFLGRIHTKKGIDLLLPAFERCINDGCGARLVIAGPIDKSYQEEFSKLVAACSARDRVDVIGTVSGAAKSQLIRGARAFILSSYSEGLPVAVLEAMSLGIPVIITAECNLPEVAVERAGVIVELNAASLSAAMAHVWIDARFRAELSVNAKRLARDRFSWDSVGTRVAELCRRIASSRNIHVA
jgi:glycosyltransferase involved in cell wall biosynthesis